MIIFLAWLSLFFLMCFVWLYYKATQNPSVVDATWSVGHALAGTILLLSNGINFRSLIIWITLIIWASRLAGYLYWTRIRVGIIDKRYTQLSKQWQMAPEIGFFLNFQMQGVLILIMVSSLYFNGQSKLTDPSWLDWFGCLVVIFATVLATTADLQLRRFVSKHQHQVCNVGWWKFSRHPNYFFEWLVWVGFTLTALSTTHGWIAVISPIILYIIMTQVTGPMTEAGSLASKGQAYKDYQSRTPMFFPLLKIIVQPKK